MGRYVPAYKKWPNTINKVTKPFDCIQCNELA